jgi:tetratricopeptide (TPR) repeat protein
VDEAAALGHFDIADAAALSLAKGYIGGRNLSAARTRTESVLSRLHQNTRIAAEARLIQGEIYYQEGNYNDAIALLVENETLAAGSGFIPLALETALVLGDVYRACGKSSREKEVLSRAWTYAQRITSSLPSSVSKGSFEAAPPFSKLLKLTAGVVDKNRVR